MSTISNIKDGFYYKYRSLDGKKNIKRLVDIIEKQRLYAANFTQLNDIIEGMFCYDTNEKNEGIENSIAQGKGLDHENKKIDFKPYRICSFSNKNGLTAENENLLWAHYADSHRGIRIEFKIEDTQNIEKLDSYFIDYLEINELKEKYTYNKDIYESEDDFIKKILMKKEKAWEYENECRVLTKESYVNIKILNITFGKGLLEKESRIGNRKARFDSIHANKILPILESASKHEICSHKYSKIYEDEASEKNIENKKCTDLFHAKV